MKVVKTKKVEGCLDSKNAVDVLYDKEVTKDFIEYLGNLGKLIYKNNLEKPFYRVIVRGEYTLKGSEGNMTTRVLLPEKFDEGWEKEFIDFVEKYSNNK